TFFQTIAEVGTCSGSECHHGGSCFQLSPNTYKCLCPYSYDGTFCETPFIIAVVITTIVGYVFMIRKAHRLIKRAYVDKNVRKSISQGIQKESVKQEETRSIVIKSSSFDSIFRRSSGINALGVKRPSFFDGKVLALQKESLSGQPINTPRKEAVMEKDTKKIGKKVCRRKLNKKKSVISASQK
ncbi:EGF-like domain protein, partial [Trichinella nativa]